MSKWFLFNFILLIFAIWQIQTHIMAPHIIFGSIGLLLILYNWTRHAVFSTIRSSKVPRKRKITLANISKKALPIHKWTGSAALLTLIVHASYVLYYFGWQSANLKMITGLCALITLTAVVIAGWLRFIRTTPRRRFTHLYLVFGLIFFVCLHLFF